MERDDLKFGAGLVATALLLAALVISIYLKDAGQAGGDAFTGGGAPADMERIERAARDGRVSLEEASHWRPLEEPAP